MHAIVQTDWTLRCAREEGMRQRIAMCFIRLVGLRTSFCKRFSIAHLDLEF